MKQKTAAKIFSATFLSLILGAAALHAYNPENVIEVNFCRWVVSGVQVWYQFLDSSNNLNLVENKNTNATAMKYFSATGAFLPITKTSAQLGTLVPDTTGEFVVNITTPSLCISSGIGTGAWVVATTTQNYGAATSATPRLPCY